MNMGSLAEVYLSAYGWRLYGIMYLVFWVSKVMLYPIVRFTFDAALEFSIKGGDSKAALRDVFIRFIIMVSVFVLGVMPMVSYNTSTAVIEMPGCGVKEDPVQKAEYDRRFGGGSGVRVPLLPYLVMLTSSGVNMAILKSMPCASDLLLANQITNNLAIPTTEAGLALRAEVDAFTQQCYAPAREFETSNANSSDPIRADLVSVLKRKYYSNFNDSSFKISNAEDIQLSKDYAGSNYYNKVLYTDEACNEFQPRTSQFSKSYKQADIDSTWADMCLGIRNNRVMTPYASPSTPSNTNGQEQQNKGIDPVRCGDWWNDTGGNEGLRNRLAYAGFSSAITQLADSLKSGNSSNLEPITRKQISLKEYDQDSEAYIQKLYNSIDEDQKEALVYQMNKATAREDHDVLSKGQKAVMVGGGLVSFITSRGGAVGDLTNIAMTTAVTKAALTLAHPILLMLIYALWLLYMVIGEFRGMTLIKGLLMIFVIKFCTSVFAIADRLSDELVMLLVPKFTDNLWTMITSSPDVAIIYMVGTLMYLAVPGIMMYLVATAGGPETSKLSNDAGGSSKQIGSQAGNMSGGGAKNAINKGEKSAIQGIESGRQRYIPRGN